MLSVQKKIIIGSRASLLARTQVKIFKAELLKKQKKIGRYYSAMPTELKTYCIKRFEIYSRNK